ncbi:MAG TPA: imidazole glycerol phosphate synthase subunit HisH [bacterium]|nr:imidazole glycerol phosphate synthase subunit HisH [bacterium]
MIAIVDYGAGNLHSIRQALLRLGLDARVVETPEELESVTALVVPGDGAFGPAVARLRALGWAERISEHVRAGRPFLGVCLGMQLLFDESEEDGLHLGLGVLPGRVVPLPETVKVPHMGWNQLRVVRPSPLLDGVSTGAYVYFLHSYHVAPKDAGLVAATTAYGGEVAAVVGRDNLWATQFHPEKSGPVGARMLQNIARWVVGARASFR